MQSASYEHFTKYSDVPSDGAVVVIKADEVDMDELNYDLARLKWVLLLVCSNEEGKWNTDALERRQPTKVWLQSPAPHQKADRYFPWGHASECVTGGLSRLRTLDWFFSGQITHERRAECVEALSLCRGNGVTVATKGFSQGLPRDIYLQLLESARMAPCPSGPITVDSFRVCEALEMGAIPMVDIKSPVRADPLYWQTVFGHDMPLPTVECWEDLPSLMDMWLENWEPSARKILGWYGNLKMRWRRELLADVEALRASR